MRYIFDKQHLYDFIRFKGLKTKTRGSEEIFEYCPYCNGGEHRDKETFSVNLDTGLCHCFRNKCDASRHFVMLARDMDYLIPLASETRKYEKPPQNTFPIREEAIDYLKTRGISEETTRRYNITVDPNRDHILVFPFYDETGDKVFEKYRNMKFQKGVDKSKEWSYREAKPILFGMQHCLKEDRNQLIITEGQIDCLSVADCGINNVVSVPMGANGFTWIDNCYDFVESFDEIIVFGDYEGGKISLVDEIAKRFPHKVIKVVRAIDYLNEKDANDIYRAYGKSAIEKAINNAQLVPINYVEELADVRNIDLMSQKHTRTGIEMLDKALGGLFFGEVAILTGKCGDGKSTFASQICANVLEDGYSIFVYSGELADYQFKNCINRQIAGSNRIETRIGEDGNLDYSLSPKTNETIDKWCRGRAFIFDNKAVNDNDEEKLLLSTIRRVICRYDVKFILIDNLMTAIDVESQNELYLSQSKFVKELKQIATQMNVFILLVAHPRKESGKKELDNDAISGSSNITNVVDVVLTYSRNESNDKYKYQSLIGITKNRLTGETLTKDKRVKAAYSAITKRIGVTAEECHREYSCFIQESSTPDSDTNTLEAETKSG